VPLGFGLSKGPSKKRKRLSLGFVAEASLGICDRSIAAVRLACLEGLEGQESWRPNWRHPANFGVGALRRDEEPLEVHPASLRDLTGS
jgi:hypothetical protein